MKSQTSRGTDHHVRHRSHAEAHHKHTGRAKRIALFTVLPACASAAAVWALLDATSPNAPAPVSGDRTVELVGQVVAVSPVSITTRGSDGTTTTFQITPDTTQYNSDGGANSVTGTAFTINETVTVTGIVNNGTPVATALADQNAGGGPPMDAV
ncbi:hypothetical protein BH09ACT8_BH09ACT8_16870 [soil metagenome]